jgi:peptide/nickel transport system substrate-binding protein
MIEPMTRPPHLARLGLALSVVSLACAPGTGVSPAPPTESPVTAGITEPADPGPTAVIVGIGGAPAPRTLNPLLDSADVAVLDRVAAAAYTTGFGVAPVSLELVPEILAEIPSVGNGGIVDNGDGTIRATFRLVPGAEWADGVPVTGSDLEFTHEVLVDPSLPIRTDLRSRHDKIVPGSMVTEDDGVTLTMEASTDAELLFPYILPRHEVEGTDFVDDWNDRIWTGAGPFVFEEYQPGQFLALRRNERYWKRDPVTDEPLPHLDRVVFRFFSAGDDPRLVQLFESRELDVVSLDFPDGSVDTYQALATEGASVDLAPSLDWLHLNFQFGPGNRNAGSLNEYRAFRRAVAHAIDRTELASERDTVPLFSFLRLYRPDLTEDPWGQYEYDTERTASYLDSLGRRLDIDYPSGDGPRLVLTAASERTGTVTMAGSIVVMLADAGIAAELQLEDATLLFGTTLDNGTWDTAAWRFTGGPGRSRAIEFVKMFDPNGLPFVGSNFYRWGTVDSKVQNSATRLYAGLIEDLEATIDPTEIDGLLRQLENLLAEEMVILPLMTHDQVGVAWWPDEVEGPAVNQGQGVAWNLATWRVPAG